MNQQIITNNFEETKKIGQEIGEKIKNGKIITLSGELGAGKTTFVQGLSIGIGVKRRIISPTFVIVRKYEIERKRDEVSLGNFYHIDLYRVENKKDILDLGIEEILSIPENIVVIEWAEKITELLPKQRMEINFEYLAENQRRITIKN